MRQSPKGARIGARKIKVATWISLNTRLGMMNTQIKTITPSVSGGHDVRNFEPRKWLKFADIDKSIQELRAMYKVNPQWFETPKPKSVAGKNEVDYSI